MELADEPFALRTERVAVAVDARDRFLQTGIELGVVLTQARVRGLELRAGIVLGSRETVAGPGKQTERDRGREHGQHARQLRGDTREEEPIAADMRDGEQEDRDARRIAYAKDEKLRAEQDRDRPRLGALDGRPRGGREQQHDLGDEDRGRGALEPRASAHERGQHAARDPEGDGGNPQHQDSFGAEDDLIVREDVEHVNADEGEEAAAHTAREPRPLLDIERGVHVHVDGGNTRFDMADREALLLVEDDPTLAKSLADTLRAQGLRVDVATTLAAARSVFARARHALALVDLGLPDGDGRALLPELRAAGCHAIVLTVVDDEAVVLSALSAGALGYVLKGDVALAPASAVESLRAGGSPLSPRVARALLARMTPSLEEHAITKREREMLELFARGLTYTEAGEVLGVSVNTVRTHVKHVYEKLHVSSKAEAVARVFGRP